ncbi:MAG: hypothetical protein DWQ40_12765 [Actinobacteria bacterium]|nr:MAG: hypothetical protein DWQ40_12765 [Actinomycetota bacterium]
MSLPDRLQIEGELTAVSPTGSLTRLEAAGNSLHWQLESLTDLVGVSRLNRDQRRQMGALLEAAGLELLIHDSRGVVLEAGRGIESRFGRVLTGSRRIRPRRLWSWLISRI